MKKVAEGDRGKTYSDIEKSQSKSIKKPKKTTVTVKKTKRGFLES